MTPPRCSSCLVLVGLLALVAFDAGCSGAPDALQGGDGAPQKVLAPRVPDDVLQAHGLETIWYNRPDRVDTEVQSAALLPEGLFVWTQPVRGQKGRLKLINRSNGSTEWYFEIEEALTHPPTAYRYPQGTPGVSNEVYFTQVDTVHCLDLRYGDEMWRADISFPVSTSLVAGELNFFGGSDNRRVHGVSKKSRIEAWSYATDDNIAAPPAVRGGDVYVASMDGALYKFSAISGWVTGTSRKFQTGAAIVSEPVLFSLWVLVGSTDYKLYCLRAQDLSVHWTFQAEAPIRDTPVAFAHRPNQEYVYCTAMDPVSGVRTLFAVELRSGREVWRREGLRKVVSIGRDNLYTLSDATATGEQSLVALDVVTGAEKFRISAAGFSFVPLNSADAGRDKRERGRIYLIAQDGTVQVIGERL